jgi:signal transduction histidine kinase
VNRHTLKVPLTDFGLVCITLLDVWYQVDISEYVGLACALAACLALLFRRSAPLAVFALTLPAVFFTWAIYASLIALFTLATRTRNRNLLIGCTAAFAFCTMFPWPIAKLDALSDASNLVQILYGLATAAAPAFLGQLVLARRELAARLDEITDAHAHEELLIAQNVLAKERAQLAREMHDVVSHQVSLIAVRAGALQVRAPDADTKQAAITIRQLSVRTLDELRYMVNVLRASGSRPTELTPQPTLDQLPDLVAGSATDARLTVGVAAGTDLPPPVQRAVYRTVQEGLTNARKHAPGSTTTVEITQDGDQLHTTITNTAATRPALPLPSAHHGLAGLRQRAELLGGTLRCGPTPDGGYQLGLDLPIDGRTTDTEA